MQAGMPPCEEYDKTLRASWKQGGKTVFDMGIWGGTAFQILIVLAYILAAAGSMVPIK
jgi:hypothetical protein